MGSACGSRGATPRKANTLQHTQQHHTAPPAVEDSAGAALLQYHQASAGVSDWTQAEDAEQSVQATKLRRLMLGQACVFLTAILWATYAPSLRYLYLSTGPPVPSVMGAIQTSLGAACLCILDRVLRCASSRRQANAGIAQQDVTDSQLPEDASLPPTPKVSRPRQFQQTLCMALSSSTSDIRLAGMELGAFGFLANCATIIGFAYTTTARGAFLIRLSAMFTPIITFCLGESVPPSVWLGCVLAAAGGAMIGSDQTAPNAGDAAEPTQHHAVNYGDAMIVMAAFLWAIQTVRLGKHAVRFPAITLASLQIATVAVLSMVWVFLELAVLPKGSSPSMLWPGYRNPIAWIVMLWPGIFPWGIGTALQIKGQSLLSPSLTQIILASDPLFAVLFAGLLGGQEGHMGWVGWLGAGAIVSASLIGSRGSLRMH